MGRCDWGLTGSLGYQKMSLMFFVINDLFGLAMPGNMNEIGDPGWLLSVWMLLQSDSNMLLRERRV